MSLRKAIDAKCKDCIYDPECGGGTWREQIAQCTSVSCPLWPVRTGPESGPWADYPTDPDTVSEEWLRAPVGCRELSRPIEDQEPPEPDGECFRGGEAEAYLAEQQAWIQRNLK